MYRYCTRGWMVNGTISRLRPRLTKDKKKFTNIQVDWSLWIDEDEEGKEPGTSAAR